MILLTQLRSARHSLARPGMLSDAQTHAARKQLKCARATLRLLRALIGDAAYRRANRALRDAAAPLGAARDIAALLKALDALRVPAHRAGPAARALRRVLRQQREVVRRRLRSGGSVRAAAISRLMRVARQARGWPRSDARAPACAQSAALAGLRVTYRHGRRSYAAVRRRASDAALHEWRKQSKYLANELRLLRALPSRRIDAPRRRAARIAENLGTDHDLALLRRQLQRARWPEPAARPLLRRIERERSRLQARALADGERLYRIAPAQFAAHLQRGR